MLAAVVQPIVDDMLIPRTGERFADVNMNISGFLGKLTFTDSALSGTAAC